MKKIIIIVCCFSASFCLYARGTAQAVVVNPYLDFGYVNPADINDKITMNPGGIQTFAPGAGTIHWAKNIGAFVGYKFNHRFNVGLIFDRIGYATVTTQSSSSSFSVWHPSSTAMISGVKYYEFSTGGSTFSFGPAFYYTFYSGGKISFDTGVGVLYGRAKYYEDASYSLNASGSGAHLSSISGSGSAFGFQLNTSTTYYVTNYLGVSLDLGYRYLKCSSLTDANGNTLKFQFNNGTLDASNMALDFSGIYFGFGLKFDFNIASSGASESPENKPAEDQNFNEKPAAGTESNANWENAPAPTEAGPTLDEIRDLKKQVQRKYNEIKTSEAPDAQAKSERYQKLYDITNRLEKDWDQFSPKSRRDKIEKIKLILSR